MTALSADKKIEYREGVELEIPVSAADTIYAGAMVCVGADGYALPAADTAGLIFVGISREYVDNSAGADGDENVTIRRTGLFKMLMGTAITIANVGDNVFVADDATVDLVANVTNAIYVGIIAEYIDTTHAWVDITPAIQQADVATHIADTSAAHAASAISIADSGGFTTETAVEGALAEIYPKVTAVIADPGDGGAIPVTKSGTVAITTTGVDDTRTLAIPTFAGQQLDISLDVDAGDAVITVAAAVNQTGNNTLTGADAGDHIRLVGVQVGGALVWRVAANDGWALSTV